VKFFASYGKPGSGGLNQPTPDSHFKIPNRSVDEFMDRQFAS
jgi:hypothetical protein